MTLFGIGCGTLYGKSRTQHKTLIPVDPNISEDELFDVDDDQDPDFVPISREPLAKRRCAVLLFVEEDREEEEEDREAEEEEEEETTRKGKGRGKANAKPKRRPKSALQLRPTTWKKEDISNPPLPSYNHQLPSYVESPQQYFNRFFTLQLIKHITYQTNLYATQKDVGTTFSTTEHEISNFVAILLYMGVVQLPSLDDYWAMDTRVPQVADIMSSKRFRQLRQTIHFNDNSQLHGTIDRFFKVRPLFTNINEAFRREPETPKQSVDEVMVGYKGKAAGNLRRDVQMKPNKMGFKLFSRASEDGFIYDMILYQGLMEVTLQAHGIPLSPEQKTLTDTSQVVTVLASIMNSTCTTALFADDYFTSLELVRYL
ncbi:hypothetical protein Pcinc_010198 [Petrolisthes cinctipes]|uniref:PiggyBac transposable element-derived protein domain-containing protein n=1 Tax=Petrolisthes cinctipes TaxID=88211 RepID=A0AAE1KVN7_PETCI|nr:hypothetical protein Pcinc_010198 [Petrolisthes cinctipes]